MSVLRSPLSLAGLALVVSLVVLALLAPLIAPYDPRAVAGESYAAPSWSHLLGTNDQGQDLLSRLIWGARASLVVAVTAASLAVAIGVAVGAAAAFVGGIFEVAAMRLVDIFLALPQLPLLVLVAAFAGASRVSVVVVIGVLFWPPAARIVRSQTLSLRQRGFVQAAQGFGGGLPYLLRQHLVPALGPVLVALFVAFASNAILLDASLAFLGLSDPEGVSWGLMLNDALAEPGLYFTSDWVWWVLPAGLAITLAVIGFSFLGVGLETTLNPRVNRGGAS